MQRKAARHGALTLVQIDPTKISLAAIASGQYDDYLRTYADSVRSFGHKVILGFGHEMNGPWYSWGWTHTRAKVFVAAWRHIVDVFRQQGASNVIWLWTVNVDPPNDNAIQNPARWWPGSTYVNWVGIDGYYLKTSWSFAPLFGPTIKIVHSLSRVPIPILISEVGAPTRGPAGEDRRPVRRHSRLRAARVRLVRRRRQQGLGSHHPGSDRRVPARG